MCLQLVKITDENIKHKTGVGFLQACKLAKGQTYNSEINIKTKEKITQSLQPMQTLI